MDAKESEPNKGGIKREPLVPFTFKNIISHL